MVHQAPIGVDKSCSLADLNTIIGEQEDNLGPLVAIGNNGQQTILTFDVDQASPANHATITPDANGQSVIPAGSSKVCQGSVFVASTLTPATASRSN
jgi:hypothetical protein